MIEPFATRSGVGGEPGRRDGNSMVMFVPFQTVLRFVHTVFALPSLLFEMRAVTLSATPSRAK